MEHIPAHLHRYGRPLTTAGMKEAIGHRMTVYSKQTIYSAFNRPRVDLLVLHVNQNEDERPMTRPWFQRLFSTWKVGDRHQETEKNLHLYFILFFPNDRHLSSGVRNVKANIKGASRRTYSAATSTLPLDSWLRRLHLVVRNIFGAI